MYNLIVYALKMIEYNLTFNAFNFLTPVDQHTLC